MAQDYAQIKFLSDFVIQLSNFLAKSSAVDLISVCVDGISSDIQAVITGAKSFLYDESKVVFMCAQDFALDSLVRELVSENTMEKCYFVASNPNVCEPKYCTEEACEHYFGILR
ncbi:hypothetical protein THRCLA_22704 [Thraustotheca clavata]|uniref:Uncharacterized protein n=1 Tax=Thraustotheca clavata TaxID=74557 RepID=A0A1V9YUE2_9STRA|nr:hypothetical protein THRCLA_22704 [Thraustotheca clavata]